MSDGMTDMAIEQEQRLSDHEDELMETMVEADEEEKPTPSGPFDLGTLSTAKSADEGQWMTATNPDNDEEIPSLRVKVYGEDSKQYMKAMDGISRKNLDREKRNRNKKRASAYSDARESGVYLASKLTADWEGVILNGAEVPCTQFNKPLIFSEFLWLADQVVIFSRERSNFLNP